MLLLLLLLLHCFIIKGLYVCFAFLHALFYIVLPIYNLNRIILQVVLLNLLNQTRRGETERRTPADQILIFFQIKTFYYGTDKGTQQI